MSAPSIPAELGQAHQRFLELVGDVRPELHRYCARMTGSITDGEDVVQETLAKAFYALAMSVELPPLRPWLFRVAHNSAIDFVRRHDRSRVDLVPELPEPERADEPEVADPVAVRAALATFRALPPLQRSAVILKDVLGYSGSEIAEMLETSVPAVKAALVRGRERLRAEGEREPEPARDASQDAALERYVELFNAGDWDGLRGLLAEEVRLDLVSKAKRRGKSVGVYFRTLRRRARRAPRARRARGPPRALRVHAEGEHPTELPHRARLGTGPRGVHSRLPLRAVHRERAGADRPCLRNRRGFDGLRKRSGRRASFRPPRTCSRHEAGAYGPRVRSSSSTRRT
ncbi:MAG: sigma-70 family RNA polymerase sigma factor [Gammaproteobacteria bacterium]|nr:sigma-70 family RNA polymerase sigma factor [Gammaproteobacteria bacterium]